MSELYRYAEHLLYCYPVNMMRIHDTKNLLAELSAQTDCHAQNYNRAPPTAGSHSDPVSQYHSRIDQLERTLTRLFEETAPVERVRDRLKGSHDERAGDMLFVMELYYFERMKLEDAALHLQKSVKTLLRRRQELTGLVVNELSRP